MGNTGSCYLCGEIIHDYSHFCRQNSHHSQTQPCKCNGVKKCHIYTDNETDDLMALLEVGERLQDRLRESSGLNLISPSSTSSSASSSSSSKANPNSIKCTTTKGSKEHQMDSNKTNQNIPVPAPPMAPTRPVLKKVKNKTTTKKQKEEHKEALQKYDQDLRLYEVAKRAYNLQLEGRNQES